MKRTTMLFCGAVLCAAGCLAACGLQRSSMAQEKPQDQAPADRDTWMQVKLTSAQQILEHLSSGDFEKLENSSRRMQVMNFMEQWSRDAEFTRSSSGGSFEPGLGGWLSAFGPSRSELTEWTRGGTVLPIRLHLRARCP